MSNMNIKFKQGDYSELPSSDIEPGAIYLAKNDEKNESYLYYGENENKRYSIMPGDTVRIEQGGTGATEPEAALKNLTITNDDGGVNIGKEANSTGTGGAIGEETSTDSGGAVGLNAKSGSGGAIGKNAFVGAKDENGKITSYGSGGAVGSGASTEDGGAVGESASSGNGGAVGYKAKSGAGFAGGRDAKTIHQKKFEYHFTSEIVTYNETSQELSVTYQIDYQYPLDLFGDIIFNGDQFSLQVSIDSINYWIRQQDDKLVFQIIANLDYDLDLINKLKNLEISDIYIIHYFNGFGDGGAIGYNAISNYGGAMGYSSIANNGGAIGREAKADSGFAGGYRAETYAGGAIGYGAKAETFGGAVGCYTKSYNGFAGGFNAIAGIYETFTRNLNYYNSMNYSFEDTRVIFNSLISTNHLLYGIRTSTNITAFRIKRNANDTQQDKTTSVLSYSFRNSADGESVDATIECDNSDGFFSNVDNDVVVDIEFCTEDVANGGAIGHNARTDTGGAVGNGAEAYYGGGAVGNNASSGSGFAGGAGATVNQYSYIIETYPSDSIIVSKDTKCTIKFSNTLGPEYVAIKLQYETESGEIGTIQNLETVSITNNDETWMREVTFESPIMTDLIFKSFDIYIGRIEAGSGAAIGKNAVVTASGSVQLGTGINKIENTLQFKDTQIVNEDGKIVSSNLSIVPVENGGTGAIDKEEARKNLHAAHGYETTTKDFVKSPETALTQGWYRIAETPVGVGSSTGIFTIQGGSPGYHTIATFIPSTSFNMESHISILSSSNFSTGDCFFDQIRLVHDDGYEGKRAYVEVHISVQDEGLNKTDEILPGHFLGNFNVKLTESWGWSLITPEKVQNSLMDGYFAEYAYLSGGTASFNVLSVGPESYGSELPIQRGVNDEHRRRYLTPGQIFFKIID